jgi:hypothetical protein
MPGAAALELLLVESQVHGTALRFQMPLLLPACCTAAQRAPLE